MTYRHELKYLLYDSDYAMLKLRVAGLLERDTNVNNQGLYTVRSLYFDDFYNSAFNEKEMSIFLRQKYRIRLYNHSRDVIHLERKLKYNNYVKKISAPLSPNEVTQIIQGDYAFLMKSKTQLFNILYYEIMTKVLRPRIIIDYEREPYVLDAGTVRITFDRNIRASVDNLDLFCPDLAMMETLETGFLIMEIKYTEFLPNMIRKILPTSAVDYSSISKYFLGCERILYNRKTDI